MAFNWRMLPPIAVGHQTRTVNGRTYTGQPGAAVSVPEHDGQILQANGWTYVCPSAPTSGRPTGKVGIYAAHRGTVLYDETLNKVIAFDGSTWRDPVNGNAV